MLPNFVASHLVRQDAFQGRRVSQEVCEHSGYYNLSLAINRQAAGNIRVKLAPGCFRKQFQSDSPVFLVGVASVRLAPLRLAQGPKTLGREIAEVVISQTEQEALIGVRRADDPRAQRDDVHVVEVEDRS